MGHGDSSQGFFSNRGLLQGSVPIQHLWDYIDTRDYRAYRGTLGFRDYIVILVLFRDYIVILGLFRDDIVILGLFRDDIVILGLFSDYIGILGLFRDYIGILGLFRDCEVCWGSRNYMAILGLYGDNGEKMETTILCALASVRVLGSSWLHS